MQAMRLGEARGLYEYEVDRYVAIKDDINFKYTILPEYNVESHDDFPCSRLTKYVHD